MQSQKINDLIVKPIKGVQHGFGKFTSSEIFDTPYPNVFLCARKKSGKTTLIKFILEKSIGPDTAVHIFCSTIKKDAGWLAIVKWLRRKKIRVEAFTSIYGKSKSDNSLARLIDLLGESDESDSEDSDYEPDFVAAGCEQLQTPKKKPLPLAPEHVIILDDIGDELRDPSVNQLVKTNRHYKAQVLISSQHLKDIMPAARKQIDVWLLFAKLAEDTLKIVFSDADFPVSYETFINMYRQATSEKFSFLYASSSGDFRIKFSEKLIPDE